MSYSILVVEDNSNLGNTLNEYLCDLDYKCKLATSVKQAQSIFHSQDFKPDIVLMDIELPDGDGITLAKEFKQTEQSFVLLFLSAQNNPEIKFTGLEMGADDYITKPFDLRELTLRLDKALQNHDVLKAQGSQIELGDIQLNFKKYQIITAENTIINLGHKECSILELLYRRQSEVISRDEIIQKVWGENCYPSNRTVDNYIVKLRKHLESKIVNIESVRGIGYKFNINTKEF